MAEAEKNPMFVEASTGLINAENAAHAVNQPGKVSMKFQLLATALVIVAALLGGVVGVVISNNGSNEIAVSWLALWGDLFIRALKCVVLPLIFINVILAVIQMIEAGKAGKVGRYTVLLYTVTTVIASIEGLVAVVLFKDRFTAEEETPVPTYIQFMCPDGDNAITEVEGGDLICAPYKEKNNASFFELNNPNSYFSTTGEDFEVITFSDTLQEGIFKKLIPDNIVNEFATGGFIGVVMFAIVFGAAAQKLEKKPVLLIDFLEDVNDILVKIIQWIIYLTPIAVFSLIAGALGGQEDLATTFKNIGVLIQASVLSFAVHVLIVYPLLFVLITRRNPYAYMRYIIPAQIFAFSCASSAATLPVTLRCVKESGQVPDSIRDFVLPIGATVNMDGTALYFPPAIVFLAVTAGLGDQLDAAAYFLIIVVSSIGSAGAAPVPNAGLVLIITAFNTVFNEVGTPRNFAIIVGIDWLMDRFQTALNVTGDTMVARIVTHIVGSTPVPGKPSSQMPVEEQVAQ